MEPEVLNRIGIILNFLAGFLLAPELLGTERLQRMEAFLERLGAKVKERGVRMNHNTRRFLDEILLDVNFDKPSLASTVAYIATFLFMAAGCSLLFFYEVEGTRLEGLSVSIFYFFVIAFSIVFLGTIILALFTETVIRVIVFLANLLITKLIGESKLRSLLVVLGIICFIAGNTLQFIATF